MVTWMSYKSRVHQTLSGKEIECFVSSPSLIKMLSLLCDAGLANFKYVHEMGIMSFANFYQ